VVLITKSYVLNKGFSLVELTVVLLLITLIASVAVRETSELAFQTRYEQTKERLEMIRQAILGNPRLIINGQQAVSGFVADMGRLPYSLRELIEDYDCDGPSADGNGDTYFTNDGPCPWSLDTTHNSGLGAGWKGPYLNVSGSPSDNFAFTDGWGTVSDNLFYGWRYEQGLNPAMLGDSDTANDKIDPDGFVRLVVQSLGRDQAQTNTPPTGDYSDDHPPNKIQDDAGTYYPRSLIEKSDWLVDISGGISVSFKKSTGKISSVSHCSDPSKTSKNLCTSPAIWYEGGCNEAGFYNKDSCPTGQWLNCSDETSATKSTCEAAGKEWYGEGFGCSDQSKPTKDLCLSSSGVWRSCSDNGAITDENVCLTADQLWYGDNIFNNSTSMQKICMRIFYRTAGSSIGVLVSDDKTGNDSPTVQIDPKSIISDGNFQAFKFTNFRDSVTNNPVDKLPIGAGAIGIYKHDGSSCTNMFYPSDRQNPVQADFYAHSGLPVINW
jgi:prepilin-type N-terminal cleavage/methylation domain-containing protein